jgi:hypothetical protein
MQCNELISDRARALNELTLSEVGMNECALDPEALLMLICQLQVVVPHHDPQLVALLVLQAVCSSEHQAGPNHGPPAVVLEATLSRTVLLYFHLNKPSTHPLHSRRTRYLLQNFRNTKICCTSCYYYYYYYYYY